MRAVPHLCLLLCLWPLACADPEEFEGTYQEQTPIMDEERDYAYVLDLFRFGDEVGGVVRFFELDGTINRHDDPFRLETTCETFGEVTLDDGRVVFPLDEGPTGETFTFFLSSVDPEDIDAVVERTVGDDVVATDSFDTDRVDTAAEIECNPPRGTFELDVVLPTVTVAEAPNLSLALAFGGYDRSGDGVTVRRAAPIVLAVPLGDPDATWTRSMTVPFPTTPPPQAMSDETDGLQLSTGYLVLFDDGDQDGNFVHNAVSDVVVALAPARVAIYIAGPPVGLSPDLRDAFDEAVEPSIGYSVYEIETTVSGSDALVSGAVRLGEGARIDLERVSPENPVVFPVLVP